jgi:hypothetical protein
MFLRGIAVLEQSHILNTYTVTELSPGHDAIASFLDGEGKDYRLANGAYVNVQLHSWPSVFRCFNRRRNSCPGELSRRERHAAAMHDDSPWFNGLDAQVVYVAVGSPSDPSL